MKTLITLSVASLLLFLTSCSSTYLATGSDDVYYTPNRTAETSMSTVPPSTGQNSYDVTEGSKQANNYVPATKSTTITDSVQTEYYVDEEGNANITNNYYGDYYDYDDYYDYTYASRIRRFHTGYYSGFGYYHNYYTDMYWYTYDPFYYGVSIYYGYPWWYPSYYSYYRPYSWYWGYGYGYGYYNPWYYGYGYGYGYGYYGGYWNGYYDGYWDGYHNYYYNSYDGTNGTYYGPRNYITSGDGSGRGNNAWFGSRYEESVASQGRTQQGTSEGNFVESSSSNGIGGNISRTDPSVSVSKEDKAPVTNATRPGEPLQTNQATQSEAVSASGSMSDTRQDKPVSNASETSPTAPRQVSASHNNSQEQSPAVRPQYQRPVTNTPVRERTYTPPVSNNPSAERPYPVRGRVTEPTTARPSANTTQRDARTEQPAQSGNTQTRPNSGEPVKTYSKPRTESAPSTYRQPGNNNGYKTPESKPPTATPTRPNSQNNQSKPYTRPSTGSEQPSTYSRPSNPAPSRPQQSTQQESRPSQPYKAPSVRSRNESYSPPTQSSGSSRSSGSSYQSTPRSSGHSSGSSSGSSYSSGSSSRSSGSSSSSSGSSSRSSGGSSSSSSGRRN